MLYLVFSGAYSITGVDLLQMGNVFTNRYLAVIAAVVAVLLIVSMRQSSKKNINQQQNLTQIEQINEKTRDNISEFEAKILDAEDDFSKEKQIRDELHLQKPGERVIVLTNVQAKKAAEPAPEVKETPWEGWKRVLF